MANYSMSDGIISSNQTKGKDKGSHRRPESFSYVPQKDYFRGAFSSKCPQASLRKPVTGMDAYLSTGIPKRLSAL
jgi:hypothetical protein